MTERRSQVQYTVEAKAVHDSLSTERQAKVDHAVRVLARDPFHKLATAQIGPNETYRKAYVAPGIVLEYVVVREAFVVVLLELFDESSYLIDESEGGSG
ncbi:hypothetical protein ACH4SP_25780 [Streptomyces sp. NPDC021093]|uniref:hypothetical protein n=1 Tax=Streptomyces sp. NPDC021093 TaxID=3365112 RepID=UPI0037BCC31A